MQIVSAISTTTTSLQALSEYILRRNTRGLQSYGILIPLPSLPHYSASSLHAWMSVLDMEMASNALTESLSFMSGRRQLWEHDGDQQRGERGKGSLSASTSSRTGTGDRQHPQNLVAATSSGSQLRRSAEGKNYAHGCALDGQRPSGWPSSRESRGPGTMHET